MKTNYLEPISQQLRDPVLLIARVCLALLFLLTALSLNPTANSLTNAGMPFPAVASPLAITCELAFSVALIAGIGTRCAALLGVIYVVITLSGHLWWQYPLPQQMGHYSHFLKNICILGGLFAVFVTGAGRLSVDYMMANR